MKPSVDRGVDTYCGLDARYKDVIMLPIRAAMWNHFTLFDISHLHCKRYLVLIISRSCLKQRKPRQYLGVTMCHCETLSAVIKDTALLKVNQLLHIWLGPKRTAYFPPKLKENANVDAAVKCIVWENSVWHLTCDIQLKPFSLFFTVWCKLLIRACVSFWRLFAVIKFNSVFANHVKN